MGFSQALSGLNASSSNLNVIGNNIANSQTVGFKSSNAVFADVFAGAKIGAGVSVSSVVQNFSAGNVEGTGRALDLAISGEGFFKFNQGGQVVYSRNGQLTLTPAGFLENAQGARLMSNEGVLQVPSAAMPASATTKVSSVYNLKSSDDVVTGIFDPTDSATFNYASTASVYDSLGNVHQLTTYYRKTGINEWEVHATLNGNTIHAKEVDANGDFKTNPADDATGLLGNIIPKITFDANGVLPAAPKRSEYASDAAYGTALDLYNEAANNSFKARFYMPGLTIAGSPAVPGPATPSVAGLDSGADPLAFVLDLTGTTQFGNDYDQSSLTQDGYTAGSLVGITIDKNGTIVGNYSNEQKQTVGSLILATFRTPEGLQAVGNNVWVETAASGQPLFGTAGIGRFGTVESGALEVSNVDMTKELVNLIIAQRTFQANAQSVKAQSDLLEQAVNLR